MKLLNVLGTVEKGWTRNWSGRKEKNTSLKVHHSPIFVSSRPLKQCPAAANRIVQYTQIYVYRL